MSKPRIYIAVADFHPSLGGTEQQARMHSHLLRERGCETTVVTFRHHPSWPRRDVVDGVPVIRVAGWPLIHRQERRAPLRKLSYLMAMAIMGWTLWRQRRHYDIVHVYKLNVLALSAALVCRVTGTPLLVSVRATGVGDATRLPNDASWGAGLPDRAAPVSPVAEHLRMDGDLEDLERIGRVGVRLTRYLLRRNGAVVVALSSQTQTYLAAHHFELPHVHLVPNGVDIIRFAPPRAEPSSNERAQTVICVSKLRYQKGIDVLLRAWRLVRDQVPQARLIVVGDGPLEESLQHLAKTLDIADSVEFTGRQTDVPTQLHRGGLAVLASRYEGMPNAILEAMACGLPCVATRVSGSEDIIQHGMNGLLVEPEDVDGLAQALLTLLRDPALARTYGRAARAAVENHYALEHIMDVYMRLYEDMADGRKLRAESASQPALGT